MTTDDNTVEVKRCHDRQKIEVSLPDDLVYLDGRETTGLIDKLCRARDQLQDLPSAPEPLDMSEHFCGKEAEQAKEWARTSDCIPGYECYIEVGNLELTIDEARQFRAWIGRAIEYHEKTGNYGKERDDGRQKQD